MMWYFIFIFLPGVVLSRPYCGGVFTARRGVLQTPTFPQKFQTPIDCEWVIKAENKRSANTSIIVYLTQMYLNDGFTFTEYIAYDKRYPIDGNVISIEGDIAKVNYVMTRRNVLVISIKLDTLEANHFRVLDNFLDVYGFNITYEITNGDVREDYCTMMDCGFTGICYDYIASFGCKCFDGYSGPKCSEGPKSACFNVDGTAVCQNGANCTHIGDTYIKCECPEGYTGEKCDSLMVLEECEECLVSCIYDGQTENACKCSGEQNLSNTDLQVYTSTVQLSNIPSLEQSKLKTFIKDQIIVSFKLNNTEGRNLQITSLESLQSAYEVTFFFYGSRKNENQLRSVINTWSEIGFIGNMTVANPDVVLYKEPILSIQSVEISPNDIIHENEEFILSCSAQGSPNMSFRWYKDGLFINVTHSKNNKWMTLRKGSALTTYIAILTVERASLLDGGLFTCQIEDYSIQQCLSKRVYIKSSPSVTLSPMSLTVSKGENFSITCRSHNLGNEHIYSWTKNGHLLPIKTRREHYDTLYPTGSLLQVSGLSKSANYSCLVQHSSVKREIGVFVTVIDKGLIKTCGKDNTSNVIWSETSPGSESIQWCPENYTGLARRFCRMQDVNTTKWEVADLSSCTSDKLQKIITDFDHLCLGYEATTPVKTLNRTLQYINSMFTLLQGEGASLLKLINEVILYTDTAKKLDKSTDLIKFACSIIDKIMMQNNSLINEEQVVELQETLKSILISSENMLVSTESFRDVLNTFVVNLQQVNLLTNFQSYTSGFSTNLSFKLGLTDENKLHFGNVFSVIYNNLTNFLPSRSVLRINGTELEYEIVSNIVALWYVDDKNKKAATDKYTLQILFRLFESKLIRDWNLTCASAEFATYGYFWDISTCTTHIVNITTVDCLCHKTGTFSVLTIRSSLMPLKEIPHVPSGIIVLVGCSTCLFLAVFTGLILLFHWIFNKCCLTFLKLQCCVSVVGAMSTFILMLTNKLNPNTYLYVNTSLQIFLLTAVSTQLATMFVIYTGLLKFKNSTNVKPTSVCVITGAPIMVVFGNYLSHISLDIKLSSWWLFTGSTSLTVFLICCLVLLILFYAIYYIIRRLIKIRDNISHDRINLINKTLYLFHSIIILIISSILYINIIEEVICHIIFCITTIILGFTLLFCYIIKSDTLLRQYFLKRITVNKNQDECKKNSLSSNHNKEAKHKTSSQDTNIANIPPQVEDDQISSSSKQVIVSIDSQKQIKSIIKTPDILSRENCANLDLISSNTKTLRQCHNVVFVNAHTKSECQAQRTSIGVTTSHNLEGDKQKILNHSIVQNNRRGQEDNENSMTSVGKGNIMSQVGDEKNNLRPVIQIDYTNIRDCKHSDCSSGCVVQIEQGNNTGQSDGDIFHETIIKNSNVNTKIPEPASCEKYKYVDMTKISAKPCKCSSVSTSVSEKLETICNNVDEILESNQNRTIHNKKFDVTQVTERPKSNGNLDAVMFSIKSDLNFLLNRTTDFNICDVHNVSPE